MRRMPLILLGATALAAGAGVATARSTATETPDAALLAQTSVTIGQAIAAAEGESRGRAVEVSLEEEHGGPAWVVTTVGPNGDMSIEIDARTGAVTESGPDDENDEDGAEDDAD